MTSQPCARRSATVTAILLILVCASPALAQSPCAPLPAHIQTVLAPVAAEHVTNLELAVSESFSKLSTLAALHALAMGPIKDAMFVPIETSDTSKQTGASPRSGGTAALVEKPSFATFLALAVETGAVDADSSDTQLTLSSSLYALAAAIKGDTATTYRQSGIFTRIGFSATFDAVPGAPDPLTNARDEQLREWGVKIRLSPDRSVRSRQFEEWWNREIRPEMVRQASAIVRATSLLNDNADYSSLRVQGREELTKALPEARKGGAQEIERIYTCTLQTRIIEPIANGRIAVAPEVVAELRDTLVPTLVRGGVALADINRKIKEHLKEIANRPAASVAFRRFRPAAGRDFWETSFSYSQRLSPLTAFVSAGASRYVGREGEIAPLEGWRDVVIAGSLEYATRSPFVRDSPDLSQVTMALTAGYERVFDHTSTIPTAIGFEKTLVQARVELPLTMGVIIPISFSMSNDPALIQENQKWNKGMFFGLTFDLDKFSALTKALSVTRPPGNP